jgi:hypothetical protein
MLRERLNCGFVFALVLVGIAAVVTPALADYTIYSDTFTRTGTLDDSSPDAANGWAGGGGTTGAKWYSAGNWATDGGKADYGAPTYGGTAALPFAPVANNVYTLSADINCTSGGSEWMGLGFSYSNGYKNNSAYYTDPLPCAWAMMRNVTSTYQNSSFLTATDGGQNIGAATGTNKVSVVLNTTGATWTATWLVNDIVVRGATALTSQNINFVSMGGSGSAGYADNFTLTALNAEVPEPTSIAILVTGLIGLLAYAWRKRN